MLKSLFVKIKEKKRKLKEVLTVKIIKENKRILTLKMRTKITRKLPTPSLKHQKETDQFTLEKKRRSLNL